MSDVRLQVEEAAALMLASSSHVDGLPVKHLYSFLEDCGYTPGATLSIDVATLRDVLENLQRTAMA